MKNADFIKTHFSTRKNGKHGSLEIAVDKVKHTITCYLWFHPVFVFNYKSKAWTAHDCGWNTATTRKTINLCLAACDAKEPVAIVNRDFCSYMAFVDSNEKEHLIEGCQDSGYSTKWTSGYVRRGLKKVNL